MGGGYLRYRTSFLESLPFLIIPRDLRTQFDECAKKILDANQDDLNADVSDLEAEIDRLVYDLYGLTEEEIEIVGGSSAKEGEGKT